MTRLERMLDGFIPPKKREYRIFEVEGGAKFFEISFALEEVAKDYIAARPGRTFVIEAC